MTDAELDALIAELWQARREYGDLLYERSAVALRELQGESLQWEGKARVATSALTAQVIARERAEAALAAAQELLRDVMTEGVEHDTRSYAVVQMSHNLRGAIREHLRQADAARKG